MNTYHVIGLKTIHDASCPTHNYCKQCIYGCFCHPPPNPTPSTHPTTISPIPPAPCYGGLKLVHTKKSSNIAWNPVSSQFKG